MKTHRTALALTLCGGLLVATLAAQNTTSDRVQNRIGAAAGKLDSKTAGASVRASKLIGRNIENSQEKSVGEINDIVLNSSTGEIQYVAVTYGGILGVGDKMFAVPFEAFKVTKDPDDPDDPDDFVLVLNVTQQQLEGAKGFDEANWPNFADRRFTDGLYKRYGVPRDRAVDVRVNRNGLDVEVDRDR